MFIPSSGFSVTLIDFSLVYTKLSWRMAVACHSRLRKQESDSNERCKLMFLDGFLGSSSNSSEDNNIHELGSKPAILSRKWAWNQSPEGWKGHMKPNAPTHLFSTFSQVLLATMATNFFGRKAKPINNLIYFCTSSPYQYTHGLLVGSHCLGHVENRVIPGSETNILLWKMTQSGSSPIFLMWKTGGDLILYF